jgi:hypothetical protein
MKYIGPAVTLAVILVLTASLTPLRHTSAQSPDESQLAALAQEAVEAQNEILVTGDVEGSLKKKPKAASYRNGIQGHFASLTNRKNVLSKKGIDYKSHQTKVKVKNVKIEGTKASQTITEHVVLGLDPALGGPKSTEYEQDHVLEYVKVGDQWTIVSDRIVIPPPEPEEIKAKVSDAPMVEAPAGQKPDPQMEKRKAGPKGAFMRNASNPFIKASYAGSAPAVFASYNPSAAINYAYNYVYNYNSSYREYPNDCTNFISQAVKAGGWPYDETGSRTAPDTWYYGSFSTATTSYSWAGAHNFYQFTSQSGRAFRVSSFSGLYLGDVVQADFGPAPDGNISHTMIVTSFNYAGTTAFLTYHTNNTRDRSIDDMSAQNPGTNWYGWGMYQSF